MAQRFAQALIRTSVNVSPEFHNLCREHRIKFSEAMRTGISLILAERGLKDYDNKLNLMRRIKSVTTLLEEKSEELEKLKNEVRK